MTRKINTHRLYNVFKFIAISISIFFLCCGIYVYIRFVGSGRVFEECSRGYYGSEMHKKTGYGAYSVCKQREGNYTRLASGFFANSVGVLVLFFGGTALFNYIAPKDKK